MSEKRVEDRRRALLAGRLVVAPSRTLDCVVRDRTERGARLICRTTGIGDEVTLELKAARGFRKKARIAWRRLDDCGVEFVEPGFGPDAETSATKPEPEPATCEASASRE